MMIQNIIYDQGRKIKIQSADLRQRKIFTNLANHLTKNDPDRKITQMGKQPRIDGEGKSHKLMIEEKEVGKYNVIKKLLKLRKKNNVSSL
ncbi:MAG: hypothetical protein ABFC34_03620 [Methanobacterium sp.]